MGTLSAKATRFVLPSPIFLRTLELFVLHRFSWRLVGGALALAACSPTLNWREMRTEGAPLLALMPCKPETATRSVPMLGQPTELHMHSCEADGQTFAVAWAQLGNAAQAEQALEQWQRASLAAIRATEGNGKALEFKLVGAGVQRGLAVAGSDHQGQGLQSQMLFFAQSGKVYQAAIYGSKIGTDATTAFFDGLSLQ